MNTNNLISVAIDAMGGDFGCEPIIAGVLQALDEREFIAVLNYEKKKHIIRVGIIVAIFLSIAIVSQIGYFWNQR